MIVAIRISDAEYERICDYPECVSPAINYAVKRGAVISDDMNVYMIPDLCNDFLESLKKKVEGK